MIWTSPCITQIGVSVGTFDRDNHHISWSYNEQLIPSVFSSFYSPMWVAEKSGSYDTGPLNDSLILALLIGSLPRGTDTIASH